VGSVLYYIMEHDPDAVCIECACWIAVLCAAGAWRAEYPRRLQLARHVRRDLSTLAGAYASRYDLEVLVVGKTGAFQRFHMDTRHKSLLVHPFLTVPPCCPYIVDVSIISGSGAKLGLVSAYAATGRQRPGNGVEQ
jgi:hypothetical protein